MAFKFPAELMLKRFLIAWFCTVGVMVMIASWVYLAEGGLVRERTRQRADELQREPEVQMQLRQMMQQGMRQDEAMRQLDAYAGKDARVMVGNMQSAAMRATVIAVLVTVVLYLALTMRHPQRSQQKFVCGAAALLLLVDLGYIARQFVIPEREQPLKKTGAILKLERETPPFRVSILRGAMQYRTYNVMVSSLLNLYGIECIEVPADSRPSPDRKAFFYTEAISPLRRWQFSNVRFVLGPKQMLDGTLRQIGAANQFVPFHEYTEDGGQQAIYELTNTLPRVFAVGSWVVNTNADDVLAFMDEPSTDPHRVAIVCDASVAPRSVPDFTGIAVVTNYIPERIEAIVNISQDGLVIMATEPDAGWSVTVDGKPEKITRCNLLHQGVFVTAGAHTVVFTYYTHHWTNTVNDAAYSALPFLLAGSLAVWWLCRRRGMCC